jgi:hypothetical protein
MHVPCGGGRRDYFYFRFFADAPRLSASIPYLSVILFLRESERLP